MAKLNVELEIDCIDEEYNLDYAIKEQLEKAIMTRIEARFMKIAAEKFEAEIDKQVAEVAMKCVDDFVNTQKFPKFKNSYDQNPEYVSITEIMAAKLEAALTKTVDKNGNFTSSNYDRAGTRLDWLIGKAAEAQADEKVKTVAGNLNKHIENYILTKVKGEIMTQLSESVLQNIDLFKISK